MRFGVGKHFLHIVADDNAGRYQVIEELRRADGVINFSVSGNLCEIIVDDGESRLGPLVAMIAQGGAALKRVTLGQTDLEDVFIELSSRAAIHAPTEMPLSCYYNSDRKNLAAQKRSPRL